MNTKQIEEIKKSTEVRIAGLLAGVTAASLSEESGEIQKLIDSFVEGNCRLFEQALSSQQKRLIGEMSKKRYCKVCGVLLVEKVNWYKGNHILLCKEHEQEYRRNQYNNQTAAQRKVRRISWIRGNARDIKKYPKKSAARSKLRYWAKNGKLVKLPCEKCGNPLSEGHHTDYSKPLEVIWLCRKHHRIADKELSLLDSSKK